MSLPSAPHSHCLNAKTSKKLAITLPPERYLYSLTWPRFAARWNVLDSLLVSLSIFEEIYSNISIGDTNRLDMMLGLRFGRA